MYRLLEKIPASPRTAGPGKSNRQRSGPFKRGNRPEEPVVGAVDSPPSSANWEASDQRRTTKRHSDGSGVSYVWSPFWVQDERLGAEVAANGTCQPGRLSVVSDLPIKRLTRATRKGQSALAAEQGSFAAQFNSLSDARGGNSHRKGITRGKHLPHRIDAKTRGNSCNVPVWGSGMQQGGDSSGDRGRVRGAEFRCDLPDVLK